jgi:hypothetical protein
MGLPALLFFSLSRRQRHSLDVRPETLKYNNPINHLQRITLRRNCR